MGPRRSTRLKSDHSRPGTGNVTETRTSTPASRSTGDDQENTAPTGPDISAFELQRLVCIPVVHHRTDTSF